MVIMGGEGGVALSGTKFFNIISGVCHTGQVDLKMGGKNIGN